MRPTVLITYFEPFGGSPFNSSEIVAKKIQRNAVFHDLNYRVVLCELPVVYEKSANVAKECFDKMPKSPVAVLSLGETNSCKLSFDWGARNLEDSRAPDNANQVRTQKIIKNGGAEFKKYSLPLDEMYCSLEKEKRDLVELSEFSGRYVCNSTGYRLSEVFQELKVPYGFFHLPASECEQNSPVDAVHSFGRALQKLVSLETFRDYSKTCCPRSGTYELMNYMNQIQNRKPSATKECLSEFKSRRYPDN